MPEMNGVELAIAITEDVSRDKNSVVFGAGGNLRNPRAIQGEGIRIPIIGKTGSSSEAYRRPQKTEGRLN